jgi:hypothetical protein
MEECQLNDAASRVVYKARKVFDHRILSKKPGFKRGHDGGSALDLPDTGDLCCGGLPLDLKCELLEEGCPEFEAIANPAVARRLLRATMGDEKQAAKMMLQAAEMRVRDRPLLRSMQCQAVSDARVIGRDLKDRPTIFMSSVTQTRPLKEMKDQLILCFEAASRMTTEEGTVVLIADMRGVRAGLNCDLFALKELSDIMGIVYADRIQQVLVVDFSRAAQAIWWLIKPMMTERTKNKFAFVSVAEAITMVRRQFNDANYQRIVSTFNLTRDRQRSVEEMMIHAQLTALGEVPLGPFDGASTTDADSASGRPSSGSSDVSWEE